MTDVRLAIGPGPTAADNAVAQPNMRKPALLVSYVYLKKFLKQQPRLNYRDWVMDSGAYSAQNSGRTINLQDYIDTCKKLLAADPTLTEVFALDVMSDWKASRKNTEEMWRQGVPAIPTYHVGEPEEALRIMAAEYPKIAIGGAVGYKKKRQWATQVFARVWPKKIHGLGFGTADTLLHLPFHSADASNWEIAPCRFGNWASYGGQWLPLRGGKQNLRGEVEFYLDLEQEAKEKWAKEMTQLETNGPHLRLATNSNPRAGNNLVGPWRSS
jgi:hypothetical protein